MDINYFKFWNWGEAKFPLREDEAQEFHLQQKPYVAIVHYNNRDYAVKIHFNMAEIFL
jgi:hypothetical protein